VGGAGYYASLSQLSFRARRRPKHGVQLARNLRIRNIQISLQREQLRFHFFDLGLHPYVPRRYGELPGGDTPRLKKRRELPYHVLLDE
jgi:hypothetical protein